MLFFASFARSVLISSAISRTRGSDGPYLASNFAARPSNISICLASFFFNVGPFNGCIHETPMLSRKSLKFVGKECYTMKVQFGHFSAHRTREQSFNQGRRLFG